MNLDNCYNLHERYSIEIGVLGLVAVISNCVARAKVSRIQIVSGNDTTFNVQFIKLAIELHCQHIFVPTKQSIQNIYNTI